MTESEEKVESKVHSEIEELERTLELKKAFLNVKFTFGKGYKAVPESIRQEVTEKLQECANMLAAGGSPAKSSDQTFTDKEVEVLKAMASTIINRPPRAPNNSPPVMPLNNTESSPTEGSPSNPKSMLGRKAELLLLDSVSSDVRPKVESGCTVTILSQRSNRFYVEDNNNNKFWIPAEDLNFND